MNSTISSEERKELLTLLQNHSNLRTGQDQVLWSIFGAFWTANSILLVCIFTSDSRWDKFLVGFIVSIVGIAISWGWNRIQKRALLRLEKYEDAIIAIEEKLQIDDEMCSFFVEGTNKYKAKRKKGTARYVMKQFSKYSIWIWLLSAVTFLTLFISTFLCSDL